ncbi:hypothetical protein KR49_11820 [Synechococcus sp. KORDI-49]|nr:hypothetical protein KR49_11820 [Synechococcus sp. KORDI-49]
MLKMQLGDTILMRRIYPLIDLLWILEKQLIHLRKESRSQKG